MPSCYRVCMAVALALAAGWFNIAAAVGTGQAEGNPVMVTALKVQPANAQTTRILLEGSARFDYTVLRPDRGLITIDLYGVDASKLQPSSSVGNRFVDSIHVKSVGLPGKVAARVEVNLAQPCEVKSRFEADANTLVLDFSASNADQAPASATERKLIDSNRTAKGSLIENISAETAGERFVAKITTDGKVGYKHFNLHRPERLVLDLENVRSGIARNTMPVNSDQVERIRIGSPTPSGTRIVFDLREDLPFKIEENESGLTVEIARALPAVASSPKTEDAALMSTPKPTVKAESSEPTRTRKSSPAGIEEKATEAVTREERKAVDLQPELRPAAFTRVAPPAVSEPKPAATTKRNRNQSGGLQFGDPSFQGEPISLDITGVDLSDILRFISDNYDVNFVMDRSVGKVDVTIKVNNVPWSQVLESIFRANTLGFQREGMIVRVATVKAFADEQKAKKEQDDARIDNIPLVTEYFKLKYERADAAGGGGGGGGGLRSILGQNLSKRGNLSVNPRTNMVILTDIPERIERAREIIGRLDVAEPQVEIEARIVQANRSFLRDLGVQLFTGVVSRRGAGIAISTAQGASRGFNFAGDDGNVNAGSGIIRGTYTPRDFISDSNFIGPLASGNIGGRGTDTVLSLTTGLIGTGFISAAITAAESKGIVKTISAPRVTVQNNSQGEIRAGRSVPFTAAQAIGATAIATTTFIEATLSLTITPQITSEGNVLLRLESTNDSIDQSFAVNGQPPINRQSAKTIVLVPDGGTTIIGGINIDSESNQQTRTPGLSSIPLLGNLFKQRAVGRSTQELLFFITPRIFRGENFVTNGQPPAPSPTTPAVQPTPGGQP